MQAKASLLMHEQAWQHQVLWVQGGGMYNVQQPMPAL